MILRVLEISCAVLTSLSTVLIVILRPRWFWLMLVIVNIFGCGPKVFGYFFYDELLTACIILGLFLRLSMRNARQNKKPLSWHKLVFTLWIFYMVIESFVGILVNNDIRIFRWVLFYIILGLVSEILYREIDWFPFPSLRQFSLTVLITVTIYYIFYLAQGVRYEILEGQYGRFATQYVNLPFIFAGTAIAVFPTLISIPAAIHLLNDRKLKTGIIAWISIVLMTVVGFFYDSRISYVIIICCFLVSLGRLGFRKIFSFIAIFITIFVLYTRTPVNNTIAFLDELFQSTQTLWMPKSREREGDLTRKLQFEAGFMRIADNTKTFLFGDGIYSHRFVLYPIMTELHSKYISRETLTTFYGIRGYRESREKAEESRIFRTTAFTGLLIDSGLIGMGLFILNFIFTFFKLLSKKSGFRNMLLVVLLLSFMWMFVNNISDIVLWYLLIMPNGLLESLNHQAVLEKTSGTTEI